MIRSLACAVLLALGTVGSFAADNTQAKPSNASPADQPAAGEDRLNIELLKTLDAKGNYVRLEGRSLFLTSSVDSKAQQAGFWFDIEPDPAAPVLVDKSLPGAWDVAVAGDHAFVCDYTKYLTVFDLRNRQWRQAAKLGMPSMTENITIRGKLAYVANHSAGLTIVDIADPVKPAIVCNFNPQIDCDGLALWKAGEKDYAALYAHWESRLVLVDITDPANPRQTGAYQHDKKSFNQGEVIVDGGLAYCTSNNGLVIVSISDPANPKLVKTVDIKGGISDVTVEDSYAFLAAKANGVRVFDVSDSANPIEVGRYTRCQAFELAVLQVPQAGQTAPAQVRDAGETSAGRTLSPIMPAPLAPASYYLYAAGSPASLLLFRAPVRKGDGR
ncbi:MAG: hypothetical protein NTX50_26290 [Candidatus Sumerlaeota bacterium]|nr:hypothetical protein [Candidatus Sumerlaeota bacterium]